MLPFHFEADPDPGSALETIDLDPKLDSDPGHKHFFKILIFLTNKMTNVIINLLFKIV